jgi:hypothetical protein
MGDFNLVIFGKVDFTRNSSWETVPLFEIYVFIAVP